MRISNDETDQTNLCRNGDIEEVDETNVLIPHDLNLVNQTEPAEVIPKLFLRRVLVQTPKVHVPASVALLDRQSDLAGFWGWLSPTNLQLLSV